MDKRVYLLAAIAFVVGMVELLIGGILDLIAGDLNVSLGKAGLLITVFAFVFSISGPVLLVLTRKIAPKTVTLAALVVFAIGDLITIYGTTYSTLIASRVILAASGALLTVLSLALASRITAPEHRGRAIGLVIMGISASLVLGLPIGVSMGHALGWRSPFILNLALVALLFLSVNLFFGQVSINTQQTPLRKLIDSLKTKPILFAHLTTFFFLAGHFTLYGYLTPFVGIKLGFAGSLITVVYFIYGLAAVTGGGLAGYLTDAITPRRTLLGSITLLFFCLLIIPVSTDHLVLFWVVLVIWGVLSWAISPPIQSHLVQVAADTADIQQSLNVTALHMGIAFGTLVGGLVIDNYAVDYNAIVGALLVLCSLAAALVSLRVRGA